MDHTEHRDAAAAAFDAHESSSDPGQRAERLAIAQYHAMMANYELHRKYLVLHGALDQDQATPASLEEQVKADPRVRADDHPTAAL